MKALLIILSPIICINTVVAKYYGGQTLKSGSNDGMLEFIIGCFAVYVLLKLLYEVYINSYEKKILPTIIAGCIVVSLVSIITILKFGNISGIHFNIYNDIIGFLILPLIIIVIQSTMKNLQTHSTFKYLGTFTLTISLVALIIPYIILYGYFGDADIRYKDIKTYECESLSLYNSQLNSAISHQSYIISKKDTIDNYEKRISDWEAHISELKIKIDVLKSTVKNNCDG